MSDKPENPPAFPQGGAHYSDDRKGMSLRDYFAGQAMVGLYSLTDSNVLAAYGREGHSRGEDRVSQTFAREAYEAADAMLAARKAGAQ